MLSVEGGADDERLLPSAPGRAIAQGVDPGAARRDDVAHHHRHSHHAVVSVRLRDQRRSEASADRPAVDRPFQIRAHHRRGADQFRLLRIQAAALRRRGGRRPGAAAICYSSSKFRPNFDRAVDRGESPSDAGRRRRDRSDRDRQRDGGAGPAWRDLNRDLPPIRQNSAADAAVPVRRPRALQSRAAHRAQHRARPHLHRADVFDLVRHHARHHARARARHDGKSARHAGAPDRGDDRQDRALRRHRLCPGRD